MSKVIALHARFLLGCS